MQHMNSHKIQIKFNHFVLFTTLYVTILLLSLNEKKKSNLKMCRKTMGLDWCKNKKYKIQIEIKIANIFISKANAIVWFRSMWLTNNSNKCLLKPQRHQMFQSIEKFGK